MPIVTASGPVITPRLMLIGELGSMIEEAMHSPEPVTAYDFADELLEAVERSVRMVDDDGAVLYHD